VVVNVLVYLKLPGVIDCTQSNLFRSTTRSVRSSKGLNKPVKIYLRCRPRRLYDQMRTLLNNAQDHDPKLQSSTLADAEHAGDQGSGQEYPQIIPRAC